MKKTEIIFILLFFIILPIVLYFGFFLCYFYEKTFITPEYKVYNLPLKTDFWEGKCKIYAEVEKDLYRKCYNPDGTMDATQAGVEKNSGWINCQDYKRYLEGKLKAEEILTNLGGD